MEPNRNLKIHRFKKPNPTQFVSPGVFTVERDINYSPPRGEWGSQFTVSWDEANNTYEYNSQTEEIYTRYDATQELFNENFEEIKRVMAIELSEILLRNGGIDFIIDDNMVNNNKQITAKLKYIKQNNG